jgi:hypothetical protein
VLHVTATAGWQGIRERLEWLRNAYVRGQLGPVFGANGHHFEALPPLADADLSEAEVQLGVRLPADYRGFLTDVSAGGAGPYYGLFPFARDAAGHWGWQGDGAQLTNLTALSTNFDPGDIGVTLAALQAGQPSSDDEHAYQDWLNRYDEVLWDDQRTHGAVCLCHQGCAYRDWLVITGPLRGQMWDDERAGDVDLAPRTADDGSALTFGRWYNNWLSAAERAVFKTRHH